MKPVKLSLKASKMHCALFLDRLSLDITKQLHYLWRGKRSSWICYGIISRRSKI